MFTKKNIMKQKESKKGKLTQENCYQEIEEEVGAAEGPLDVMEVVGVDLRAGDGGGLIQVAGDLPENVAQKSLKIRKIL